MAKGVIFDIKEFSVFDGPGIRKTIFLKGCPLNCFWCHNPEGISFDKEIMVRIASCINCGRCSRSCLKTSCDACGDCVEMCPLHLRSVCGIEIEADALVEMLKKDIDFFDRTGGGVTLSGGEPLAQAEFLTEMLEKLQTVHTAVETSGHAPIQVFNTIMNLADLILFDMKHADPEIHREITGKDNSLILRNLKSLIDSGKDFIVRIPVIPGVNDSEDNHNDIAGLLADAKNVIRVEFLPYHRTAGAKYSMVGRTYDPLFDEAARPRVFRKEFEKSGIKTIIL
jgi:pyruvate formate lyase activating enzyme